VGTGCCGLGLFLYYLVFRFHKSLGIAHAWVAVLVLLAIATTAVVIYLSAKAAQRRSGVDIDMAYRTIPVD
jgi:ABC-type sugar transport system permease subunit